MQRRKPVDYSSGTKKSGSNHFSPNSNNNTVNNSKYVLPTTSSSKVMMRSKQQKKKISTISCLVQVIVVLMLATSVMMVYIATKKSSGGVSINIDTLDTKGNDMNGSTIKIREPSSNHDLQNIDAGLNEGDDDATSGVIVDTSEGQEEEGAHGQSGNGEISELKTPRKRRTTEEANAYMATQKSFSVDGEKALKKELLPLYELQQANNEKKSPIVTRWIGEDNENGEKMKYWLPKSSASDEVLQAWEISVEKMKQEMRQKDIELFPLLHLDLTATEAIISKPVENHEGSPDIIKSSSQYPVPSPKGTHVVLEPTFGKHRENVDAVFALAEGYDLKIYLLFIESLIETGFNGDLVLSVSALGSLKPGVEEYLRSKQIDGNEKGINVVAYTVTWNCYTGDGELAEGANEGIRKCDLVGMYGEDADEHVIEDPREPRPVATARFELYWAWSQYYNDDNWIMLIDSRDAHFQLNPFNNLTREVEKDEGLLYFFAENAIVDIGKSSFNSRWLKEAYGMDKVQSFFEKPIICSGSTMGQKVAMEPYLRAMVAQFDETKCKLKGCDQGFHNYLYYSNSLSRLTGVKEVKVFAQGKGIINNLGVLRTKPLREWDILNDENTVLNWDKSVSAVAHQFDRDDELNKHLKEVRKAYEDQFKNKKLEQIPDESKDSPAPQGTHVILEPTFGKHRSHVDAIFGLAEGYDLRIFLLFIESLKATGFSGDLVLSVSALGSLKEGVEDYLRSHHKEENEEGLNVVVYTVTWDCYDGDGTKADGAKEGMRMCELVGMYGNDTDNEAIPDPRQARPVATARFELYWAWSQYYSTHNWIMLIDTRDTHFQLDPFAELDHDENKDEGKDDGLLYFFAENAEVGNIGKSSFNSRWLKQAYGMEKVQSFFDKPIICSGSTMGQKVAMEPYLRAMISQFDETKCKLKGCDQGFHNYLYYSNSLFSLKGIREVVEFEQGKGIINNLGMLRTKPLREWGILNDENTVLNWDKSVSAVAHQFDRDDELNKHLKGVRREYANKHRASTN